jgi:hypothetical protein
MHMMELALAAFSLIAAYAGNFVGDYLLSRFGS